MNFEKSYKLTFQIENVTVNKLALTKNQSHEISVGSSENTNVRLQNSFVSRKHALFFQSDNNQLFIKDLGSTNGTFVNGKRLNPETNQLLNRGDKVTFSSNGTVTCLVETYEKTEKSNDEIAIKELIKKKGKLSIGRGENCDVLLKNQSTISRIHAFIELKNGVYLLTDNQSLNGTYVNGKRISGTVAVNEQDTIIIGRYRLKIDGSATILNNEIAIRATSVMKKFDNGKIGLHPCNFEIPSKSLTAIMGPSGCGKSTLLKALNGDSPPSSGKVYICGLELEANYDYLRSHIGYVPQDDIVHKELTVYQSLYFAAKLRLEIPEDFIDQKINEVLTDLNILKVKDSLVGDLSGGQRKRVGIAVEILSDPLILFLDEPTSPLDPQTIGEFLGILQRLAQKGTTVMMVTHKPEDLNYMDNVIFLAEGGFFVHQGSPKEYLQYFNKRNSVEVYAELVPPNSQKWIKSYPNNTNNSKSISKSKYKKSTTINYWNQFIWLTIRYFTVKFNDKGNSFLLLIQAPIIALLICLIYEKVELSVLFLIGVTAIWLGTNNAAREIIGEATIFKRERMYNLGLWPYLASKIVVLSFFAAMQATVFVMILFLRYKDGFNNYSSVFLWMLLLSVVATSMGLAISAKVKKIEHAMAAVPITLIPQLMLAGLIARINSGYVELASYLTLSRWGTEGFCHIQKKVVVVTPLTHSSNTSISRKQNSIELLQSSFYKQGEWLKDTFGVFYEKGYLDFAVIISMFFVFCSIVVLSLKRKDTIKQKD